MYTAVGAELIPKMSPRSPPPSPVFATGGGAEEVMPLEVLTSSCKILVKNELIPKYTDQENCTDSKTARHTKASNPPPSKSTVPKFEVGAAF